MKINIRVKPVVGEFVCLLSELFEVNAVLQLNVYKAVDVNQTPNFGPIGAVAAINCGVSVTNIFRKL